VGGEFAAAGACGADYSLVLSCPEDARMLSLRE